MLSSNNHEYQIRQGDITLSKGFTVKQIGRLPSVDTDRPNPGVAAPFSGMLKEDILLIAGGANFPDKMPWDGGRKVFHDRIYVFQINGDTLRHVSVNQRLPFSVAYGASVSLPDGVLCMGGNDGIKVSKQVFLLRWENGTVRSEEFPELPVGITNASAVWTGREVYLLGGSSMPDGRDTGNYCFKLDISKKGLPGFEWEVIPEFPGRGRIYPVAAVQPNGAGQCIYLFSGRNIDNDNKATVFSDGLVYDTAKKSWDSLGSATFPVMAGTAFAHGKDEIILLGGVSDSVFSREPALRNAIVQASQNNDEVAREEAEKALLQFFTTHKGFSKDILCFNTVTRSVTVIAQSEYLLPVTTSVVLCNQGAIITSGEISPGIRTPDLLMLIPK